MQQEERIGATRREIRYQFLLESIVLSGIGGLVGVLLGTGITLGYTNYTINWSNIWGVSSNKSFQNSTSRGSKKVRILFLLSIFSACTIGGEESQGVVTIESTTETTTVDEEITFEEGI